MLSDRLESDLFDDLYRSPNKFLFAPFGQMLSRLRHAPYGATARNQNSCGSANGRSKVVSIPFSDDPPSAAQVLASRAVAQLETEALKQRKGP